MVGLFDREFDVQAVLREGKHRALHRVHVDLRLLYPSNPSFQPQRF